jgi:hypothetical protein
MSRASFALPYFALLLAGSLPVLITACDSSASSEPTQPVSALYECRGVPGYSHFDWDSLKLELKAHPIECPSRGTDSGVSRQSASQTQPAQSVELAVHNIILDGDCRFLARTDETASLPMDHFNPYRFWNLRMPDGTIAETGEYYVNSEVRWPDGHKDTTYLNIGWIKTGCGG